MKQRIRLTESDLHRIVKESVKKVLKEAQLNELDPRTYASYADKRQEQGQTAKANAGRQAAANAWNQKYQNMYTVDKNGNKTTYNNDDMTQKDLIYNDGKVTNNQNVKSYGRMAMDKNMDVHNTKFVRGNNYFDKDGGDYEQYHSVYSPTSKWEGQTHNVVLNKNGNKDFDDYQTDFDPRQSEATNVARQMGQGTGNYVKGKGWQ